MSRLKSKTKNTILFILLFAVFHYAIGFRLSAFVIDASTQSASIEINRLTPIEANSLYISSSESSFLLNSDILGTTSDGVKVKTTDPRVMAMRKFLIDHYSPLYTYADIFVSEADKVGLDWRLVASISGVESAFGNLIPYKSNNGWGWRGGPGGAYSLFPTWKEGISTVTSRLARGYGTELTPFDIEPTYCPPCGRNPQHAWANGVTQFMNELNYYVENLVSVY
ncbi:hypothetical protein HYV12_02270 [Candidatus Dojkabacteria bacterium]|nr:hypothetical protein [Candidatus Dojkabacteria bacterium]